jgi:hypothetical protein
LLERFERLTQRRMQAAKLFLHTRPVVAVGERTAFDAEVFMRDLGSRLANWQLPKAVPGPRRRPARRPH